MQSLAVIGRYAADLAGRDTPSAFDPGSAFERMLELDFKILLLGADIQAVSMLHYSEQRLQCPTATGKTSPGRCAPAPGWETRTYRMFVRDLQIDARICTSTPCRLAWKAGPVALNPPGLRSVSVCRMADFVRVTDEIASLADPWSLVDESIRSDPMSTQPCWI